MVVGRMTVESGVESCGVSGPKAAMVLGMNTLSCEPKEATGTPARHTQENRLVQAR